MSAKCIICQKDNHYKLKFCQNCFDLVSNHDIDQIVRIQWILWHTIKNNGLEYNNAIFLNVHKNAYLKKFFKDINLSLVQLDHYLKIMQQESAKEGNMFDLDYLKVVANILALNAYQ